MKYCDVTLFRCVSGIRRSTYIHIGEHTILVKLQFRIKQIFAMDASNRLTSTAFEMLIPGCLISLFYRSGDGQ